MLTLDPKSWYVRWFFWSLSIRYQCFYDNVSTELSTKRENTPEAFLSRGTNRCFLLRTMLFTAPVIYTLHLALYAASILAVTWAPYSLFGWKVLAIVYGSVLVACLGVRALFAWLDNRPEKPEPPPPSVDTDKNPSFGEILLDHIVEFHRQRICPLIKFKQEAPAAQEESP